MQARNKEVEELESKMKSKYLTEESLGEFLRVIYPNYDWVHDQKFRAEIESEEKTYNFRPDYCCHELRLCVEFDGPDHFTKASVIQADRNKDYTLIEKIGYKVIRVPYFIQLNTEGIKILFNKDVKIDYGFNHGFISKGVTLPADFCEQGAWKLQVFLSVIKSAEVEASEKVFYQIRESLLNKINSSKLSAKRALLSTVPSSLLEVLHLSDYDTTSLDNMNKVHSNLKNNWNCVILESSTVIAALPQVYGMTYTYNSEGNISGYSYHYVHDENDGCKCSLLVEKDYDEEDHVFITIFIDNKLRYKETFKAENINLFNLVQLLP